MRDLNRNKYILIIIYLTLYPKQKNISSQVSMDHLQNWPYIQQQSKYH